MKRTILIIILIIVLLAFVSCYSGFKCDSLDEYVDHVKTQSSGYSSLGLDRPDYLFPNSTFIFDYEYVYGEYHLFEDTPFKKNTPPATCILWLQYNADEYNKAKLCLNDIISKSKVEYIYDDYIFYLHKDIAETSVFVPRCFTLIGYNDERSTLFFLGFAKEDMPLDEVNALMVPNFGMFLNTFYGDYYSFE